MKKTVFYIANLSLVVCCIFLFPAFSSAQTRGKVEVIKDPLIDTLIAKRPYLDKTTGSSLVSSGGYRVQIFFGSSRQAAYNAQAKFLNDYPDVTTYISYIEPNFKVQVGDFRTRLEAQKLQNDLRGMFTSLFIITTKINTPKSDQAND